MPHWPDNLGMGPNTLPAYWHMAIVAVCFFVEKLRRALMALDQRDGMDKEKVCHIHSVRGAQNCSE